MFELVLLLMLGVVLPPSPVTGGGYKDVARILRSGITEDSEIEPCKDFYEYACGGYIKSNPNLLTRTDHLEEEMDKYLIDSLESSRPVEGMPSGVLHILRQTYYQCKHMSHDNSEWAKEVEEIITELGGMPMFTHQTCDYEPTEFATFLALTHKLNMLYYNVDNEAGPAIFTPVLERNSVFKPQTIMKLIVKENQLLSGLREANKLTQYYANILQHYRKGLDPQAASITTEDTRNIKQMVQFEAGLFQTLAEGGAGNTEPVTYKKLREWMKRYFDTNEYFETLLSAKQNYFEQHPDSLIRTYYPHYFQSGISRVFESFKECEVKYNYALLKLIESSYHVHLEANKSCVAALAASPLKQALAALYIHTKLENRGMPDLKDMAYWIHQAIQKMIEDADWMIDESTRQSALKKAVHMKAHTGIPNLFTKKNIAAFYRDLPFDSNQGYYENRRDMATWFMDWMMSRIGESDPLCVYDHWYQDYALTIDSFYYPENNQIAINVGVSQPPFYQEDYPNFYKYGVLGYIIGHEMTHGFDEYASLYDENGDLNDWWDQATDRAYRVKAQCFVEQYNKTYMEDLNVPINGKATLDEDIADNGGIRAAFNSYKLWKKNINKNADEKHLPIYALRHLTPDKLFFISAAQFWCKPQTESQMKTEIQSSDHSPNKYRVNIPFKNFDAFSEAFGCAPGTNMNPQQKCRVW